ncbi:hypothetical protein EATG_01409 [Escherichia coli H605]|uniref:Uncharacterized protein n=1 Tax=Escherichia coli H605 TaxID=656410 RepID=A0AAJ3P1V2_ECOLX|nr:hypothetical protein EATG_01409 [Escherichia coli H605]
MRCVLPCLLAIRSAIIHKKMYDPDHECYHPPLCLTH